MSLYPCAPDTQAAIVHAATYGDAATVKRILQKHYRTVGASFAASGRS